MRIRAGYEIVYDCPAADADAAGAERAPVARGRPAERPTESLFDPPIEATAYHDIFGNTVPSHPGASRAADGSATEFVVARHRRAGRPAAGDRAGAGSNCCLPEALVYLLGQPLLRDRSAVRRLPGRCSAARAGRLGAGAGDLRLRA